MIIAVIDGQGGGIGGHLVEKLRRALPEDVEIVALGTNALATANMMKAGANRGGSGESAIVYSVRKVDLIVGTISIVLAYSMMGEVTPRIAEAVAASDAPKLLLPFNHSQVEVVGVMPEPLPHMIDMLVEKILNKYKGGLRHV